MPEIISSKTFSSEFLQIQKRTKRDQVLHAIELMIDFPEMGFGIVSEYIAKAYGTDVRKLAISPFDVIYVYDKESDEVILLGLLHQKRAR